MFQNLSEWLNWIVRWFHLIAGISWIGSSFYFMWLDSHLTAPESPKEGVEGELWMVHSGGFYQVEKRKIGPGQMPKTLHWFKWEAAFTWISGFFLLGIVYYMSGGLYLVNPDHPGISSGKAIALSISFLILSWPVYDLLWKSPLAQKGKAAAVVSFLLIAGAAFGLCQIMSGRAAFIHMGALFGTLMVANVWMRILPAQQQMIDATQQGNKPDFTLGTRAKRRSVHNSYMTFPVLFMMLSNHYPGAYSHPLNWVILILLIIVGAGIRHTMIVKKPEGNWAYAPVSAALVALFLMTMPSTYSEISSNSPVSFAAARAVINQRCVGCHAVNPTDRTFGPLPGGVSFEAPERIKALSERIKFRAVVSKTMPLANKTGITEEERALLGRWIDEGAHLE